MKADSIVRGRGFDEGDSPIGTTIRRIGGKAFSPTPVSGALLLRDLRHLFLLAQQASADYLIAATAAYAWGDRDLMLALDACSEETERTVAWLKTQLKGEGTPRPCRGTAPGRNPWLRLICARGAAP